MKKLIPVLVILGIAVGVYIGVFKNGKDSLDPNLLTISGNIEATETALSFKISGIVTARNTSEGKIVKAGDVIATLDTSEIEAEITIREAEIAAAEATLAEVSAPSRTEEIEAQKAVIDQARAARNELVLGARDEEIAAAKAALDRLTAELERLTIEYNRISDLLSTGAATQRDFDNAKSAVKIAKAACDEAEQRLRLLQAGPRKESVEKADALIRQAEQRLVLLLNGTRAETIEAVRAKINTAQAALAHAKVKLALHTLLSPVSGIVLIESTEVGEFVSPGTPIVTIADLSTVRLRCYIPENQLGRVKLGMKVQVKTDTWPDKLYEGTVSYISPEAEFTPKNIQTQKERVKLVYRITIILPNPDNELKAGMPADVMIRF